MEGDCEIVVKALVEDNPSLASHERLTKDVGLFFLIIFLNGCTLMLREKAINSLIV